jgi:hypothetical protein
MDKKVNWYPNRWAEKTKMLSAAERGVMADVLNTMFMTKIENRSGCSVCVASMDTWAVLLRMSTESVRKAFAGLEAAGVIQTKPKPDEAAKGVDVLHVTVMW